MISKIFNTTDDHDNDDGISDKLKIQLIKRICKIDQDDGFIACLIPILEREIKDSNHNKNMYFRSEVAILLLTCVSGLVSVLGTNKFFDEQASTIIALIASTISFTSTFLVGLRGIKKWQETWLRHRRFVNLCNMEIRKYADFISPYEKYKKDTSKSDQENTDLEILHEMQKLQEFKECIYGLIEQNNLQFMNNMEQQSK